MAFKVLDQIFLTNREWHTREANSVVGTYAIGASNDHRVVVESVGRDIALLGNDIGLMTKKFGIVNSKKVNTVSA